MSRGNLGWQLANMTDYDHLADTASGKGPSPKIWSDCPLVEMLFNPGKGFFYFDDFMGPGVTVGADANADAAGWTTTFVADAADAEFGPVIGVGGELHLANLDNTADHGIQAQLLNCCVKPEANKTIWFEARVQISHVDNQIFIGVASTDTTLIASGALDETNPSSIGFFTDVNSSSGLGGIVSQKAGSNDTTEDVVTMAASTWYKLGFRVDGVSRITFYQNGEPIGLVSDTDDIADAVEMALSLVCQNEDGTNANTLKVDWVRVAQLR
jgi:hypothetical protein